MQYFQRTVRKLDNWMSHCRYKQIHVAILERVFSQVWHERTVAQQTAAIRAERDLDFWEAIKDLPTQQRKKEGLLHSSSGPQLHFSGIFAKVWGAHWRSRIHSCANQLTWKASKKDFVVEACSALNLPAPGQWYLAEPACDDQKPAKEDVSETWLPEPICLKRDQLWDVRPGRPQLEFVVDNQAIAQLMNLEVRSDNSAYEEDAARMRTNTYLAYSRHFDYKGGYLSCHDWRPREYNALADRVCGWVLARGCNLFDIDLETISHRLKLGGHLQIHSDGGYNGIRGAAAAVFIVYVHKDSAWCPEVFGYCGMLIDPARSAFHAELVAADLAICKALEIGSTLV